MRKTCLILAVLVFVVLLNISRADDTTNVTSILPEHQKVLADAPRFRDVHVTTKLPLAVFSLCADSSGKLAEPGQKWQVTDVIIDVNLPRHRLIWAAMDENYYVVHFESGGIAHSFEVMIVTMRPDTTKPTIIWQGYATHFLKDYPAFIREMQASRLIGRP